jgi:hypothetical protein
MTQRGYSIEWSGAPNTAVSTYENAARLKFNSKYCIEMSSVQLKFFKRTGGDVLVPVDPPEVRFEVYD